MSTCSKFWGLGRDGEGGTGKRKEKGKREEGEIMSPCSCYSLWIVNCGWLTSLIYIGIFARVIGSYPLCYVVLCSSGAWAFCLGLAWYCSMLDNF